MCSARSTLVAAALCALTTASAYGQNGAVPTIPTTETTGAQRTAALDGRVFRALIQPTHQSTVTGTMSMVPAQNLGTTITVRLVGAEPGTYYWHVHVGSCDSPGALLGDRAAYQPIKVGSDGRATLRQTMNFPPPTGGNYHVIIHKGGVPSNEGAIVACGGLLETGV